MLSDRFIRNEASLVPSYLLQCVLSCCCLVLLLSFINIVVTASSPDGLGIVSCAAHAVACNARVVPFLLFIYMTICSTSQAGGCKSVKHSLALQWLNYAAQLFNRQPISIPLYNRYCFFMNSFLTALLVHACLSSSLQVVCFAAGC